MRKLLIVLQGLLRCTRPPREDPHDRRPQKARCLSSLIHLKLPDGDVLLTLSATTGFHLQRET